MSRHVGIAHPQKSKSHPWADDTAQVNGTLAPNSKAETGDAKDVDVSDRVLELVMDDRGPASIIMRDTEPRKVFAAAPSTLPNQETPKVQFFGQQSNSETYVLMDDEELMKHALPSHEEEDPLRVEIPDGKMRKDALKVETPVGEEEVVHIVCQWMRPQHCAKTFPSVYEFNTHVRVDHVEVQVNLSWLEVLTP